MKMKFQLDESMRKKADLGVQAVLAWLGTYGISYMYSLQGERLFSFDIFSLAVFGILWVLIKLGWQDILKLPAGKERRRRLLYSFFTALLFSLCLLMGWQLRGLGITEGGYKGKGMLFLRSICLSFAIFPFSYAFFTWGDRMRSRKEVTAQKLWKIGRCFLLVWLFIFLAWIPSFLAYYPSVMSYDFHRQYQEAMRGFIWFNDYQPLAHTWLIWLFLRIGELFGSYQTGMACFSLFQMLVFSASCGYACTIFYRLVKRKRALIILALFYGIFPYYSVLAVCTTKDVMFTALFQVFVCLLLERTFFYQGKRQLVMDAVWVFEGILMMLFRNNALYAVAVYMILFCVLIGKKQRLRVLAMALVLIVGGKGALEGMHLILGTDGRGSKVEMFSVPIQQFARVGYYHSEEMDPDTWELLNQYVPAEYWKIYNPPLSDTVKNNVGVTSFETAWKDHYGDVLLDWAKLGIQYPNEYIDAFLALTCGYWFLEDVTWAEVLGVGLEGRMGAVYTYMSSASDAFPDGIPHESKWPAMERLLEEIVSANAFYEWPVFSNLFKPAFWCWGLLLTVLLSLYTRRRKALQVSLLPLLYLATMFLGPVVQVRYVLPIIAAVPLMIAAWLYESRRGEAKVISIL